MPTQDETLSCEACGAVIYPEHLQRQTAGRINGKLLCTHCLHEARERSAAPARAPAAAARASGDPLTFSAERSANIRFGGEGGITFDRAAEDTHKYRRPLLTGSTSATRCRTFHCRLADAAFAHLNEQVNEWADSHPDIQIKFATSVIGVVEGKHADPHLIVTVFY
jgi:hypothetical protein